MNAAGKVQAARDAIAAGHDWDSQPVVGFNLSDGGGQVFGLKVRTRKPGGRWTDRFHVWAKEGQTAQTIEDGIRSLLAGEAEVPGATR